MKNTIMKKLRYFLAAMLAVQCMMGVPAAGFEAASGSVSSPQAVLTRGSSDWRNGVVWSQSFQTYFTEYSGDTWFASYDSLRWDDAVFRIIQNNRIVETLESYIPDFVKDQPIYSIDMVSFIDYDYDGDTDILIMKSWYDSTVAVVYDGYNQGSQGHRFVLNKAKSDYLNRELDVINYYTIVDMLEESARNKVFPYEWTGYYVFTSGYGSWESNLDLRTDGSFTVTFSDMDMAYDLDSVLYRKAYNTATGRFVDIELVAGTYYKMWLEDYSTEIPAGTQWRDDSILYQATEIKGLYPGYEFWFFPEGTRKEKVPEEVSRWYPVVQFTDAGLLTKNIIYNVSGYGAFGGPYS